MTPPWITTYLSPAEWKQKAAHLEERLGPMLRDYVQKRSWHIKNPVLDFLFEYYNYRPATLLKWSPGLGVALQGEEAESFLEQKEFVKRDGAVMLDPSLFPQHRHATLRWIRDLLQITLDRAPVWGCFGMHEWAMVYRIDRPRHAHIPLRLPPDEIAAFVESRPLLCTHFDAFRFFTPEAKPMNRLPLTRMNQEDYEQPGCLHANMDLYKWAHKLFPWLDSELLTDAFLVACETRTVDMQASPYDMREHGLEPICVETVEGRQLYQEKQQAIMQRATPVRQRLLHASNQLLSFIETSSTPATSASTSYTSSNAVENS